jgi:hypothetical protein
MKEENTGAYYPRDINIMFISLQRLSEENTLCGELSKFLLGTTTATGELSNELKPITEMFKREYTIFKENEEVVQSMTILEERLEEGKELGRAEAEAAFKVNLEALLISKIKKKAKSFELKQFADDLGISHERLDELVEQHEVPQKKSLDTRGSI